MARISAEVPARLRKQRRPPRPNEFVGIMNQSMKKGSSPSEPIYFLGQGLEHVLAMAPEFRYQRDRAITRACRQDLDPFGFLSGKRLETGQRIALPFSAAMRPMADRIMPATFLLLKIDHMVGPYSSPASRRQWPCFWQAKASRETAPRPTDACQVRPESSLSLEKAGVSSFKLFCLFFVLFM